MTDIIEASDVMTINGVRRNEHAFSWTAVQEKLLTIPFAGGLWRGVEYKTVFFYSFSERQDFKVRILPCYVAVVDPDQHSDFVATMEGFRDDKFCDVSVSRGQTKTRRDVDIFTLDFFGNGMRDLLDSNSTYHVFSDGKEDFFKVIASPDLVEQIDGWNAEINQKADTLAESLKVYQKNQVSDAKAIFG